MPHKQTGVALIVSLVMLVIVTVIAAAGIGVSSMNESMSGIARNKSLTFQAAESAARSVQDAILAGDMATMQAAMSINNGMPTQVTRYDTGDQRVSAGNSVRYLGEIAVTSGNSMDANESSTLLKGYRFEIRGEASVASANTVSRVYKGIEYH